MSPWRTSVFKDNIDVYQKKIEHTLALYKFQTNNNLCTLANNTNTKLTVLRLKLAKYYFSEYKLVLRFRTKYLAKFYELKNSHYKYLQNSRIRANIHFSKLKLTGSKHAYNYLKNDFEEQYSRKERQLKIEISKRRVMFENVNACHKLVKKYYSIVISLGAIPFFKSENSVFKKKWCKNVF